jgi:hypothetical protein
VLEREETERCTYALNLCLNKYFVIKIISIN